MARNQAPARTGSDRPAAAGFTLVEALVALFILSFGLLAAGQLTCLAINSRTLARSKAAAAVVAQSKMESLAALYQSDPADAALQHGPHGPEAVTVADPGTGSCLNRFAVSWHAGPVADPRPGKELRALKVTVTVAPLGPGQEKNLKAWQNKEIRVTGIFSWTQVP